MQNQGNAGLAARMQVITRMDEVIRIAVLRLLAADYPGIFDQLTGRVRG